MTSPISAQSLIGYSVAHFIYFIYYNLWHTITEANGCNAKESRTPYYSRTPKVQKTNKQKKSFKYNTNPLKNFLTKALKIFTLVASRMERGREFHVSTTLLKKEYLKTFVLAYLIFRVNLSLCLNEKRSVSL